MRIALDEIDPHIATQYAVMAPVPATRTPAPRSQRKRLSRRKRIALTTVLVVPPMLGLQLAILAAAPHPGYWWLPWSLWFGTWAVGTGLGCRAVLKGHLASRRAAILMTINALVTSLLGFGIAVSAFGGSSSLMSAFWITWLLISLPTALLGSHLALNSASKPASVTTLQPETMKPVFASLSLTRAERVYCDVLLFLSRANPDAETEQTMRETLQQLNDLMQSSRQLEEQRLSLLPLLGANVVPELRAEYDRLKQRLDGTTDQITRASLEQSRRMVVSRIEDAHNLQTGLERLNTQQEAITQTISSTLSALGRMQLTSGSRAEFAMNDVAQTVMEMNQQTIAVESAVEEVLTLRSSTD